MLNPEVLTDEFVEAIKNVPAFVEALGGVDRIIGHKYFNGLDFRLAEAVGKMANPSVLVAYRDRLSGNFNGMTVFKHRFEVYIKPPNVARDIAIGALGLENLLFNSPMEGTTVTIRNTEISPGLLMDPLPTVSARQDEDLQDYFCSSVVFAELGDD